MNHDRANKTKLDGMPVHLGGRQDDLRVAFHKLRHVLLRLPKVQSHKNMESTML